VYTLFYFPGAIVSVNKGEYNKQVHGHGTAATRGSPGLLLITDYQKKEAFLLMKGIRRYV